MSIWGQIYIEIFQRIYKINIKIEMAFSPSRKNYTYTSMRREPYTQNRQQNMNQTNFRQNSPSIQSPRLNDESEYTKLRDIAAVDELKTKLETVLRHNSHLLNENGALSEMVNNLKLQIQAFSKKEEADAIRASKELKLTIDQLQDQQKLQEGELGRLLEEISRLHQDCFKIQCEKNNEIKVLTERHEKQMAAQIRNLKRSSEDARELYEIQIRKLKESNEIKNFEYEALKSQTRIDNEKLKGDIEEYKNQIKHIQQLKEIEIRQINEIHRQEMQSTVKNIERENALTISKFQNKVKKIKSDLINKTLEIQQAGRKGAQNAEEHQQEILDLVSEKQRLLEEITQIQISGKQTFLREKGRIIQISELERKNLQSIAENERECLKSQINKLTALCNSKTEEIRKLYQNISEIKSTNAEERKNLDNLIEVLRKRIKVLEENSLQEIELLKVKMAQLHEADIVSLEKYYETEISLLLAKIKQLEDEKKDDRSKIHRLLQENDELRKFFQIELTKYKAKVQDYKVKFAAANLQFREQITSLGTKMELTSQTLLREAEQKQKGAEFFEAEKKKFHALIAGKDKELATANQMMNRLKQIHGQELKQVQNELQKTKQALVEKTKEVKEAKKSLQEEFEMKSQKIIEERSESPNDILTKQNIQLRDKLQESERQIFKNVKQIEHLQKQIKSLQQELGLRAGFLETMQLESSAAIEDEKSKMKILMNENQVAMKDYYETKMITKDKDIGSLKEQLHEKETDIRQLIGKYNQLQKRLQELLNTNNKLSEFEEKIQNLGLDQNLVKNMAELFTRYQK